MADATVGKKVYFPALDEKQREPVEAALGDLVAVAIPLDYHTYCWANAGVMTAAFTGMIGNGYDLNFLIVDFRIPNAATMPNGRLQSTPSRQPWKPVRQKVLSWYRWQRIYLKNSPKYLSKRVLSVCTVSMKLCRQPKSRRISVKPGAGPPPNHYYNCKVQTPGR